MQPRAAQAATKYQKSLNTQLVDASSPEKILAIVAHFKDPNFVNVTTAFHRLCRVSFCSPLQLFACLNLMPGSCLTYFDQSLAWPAVLLLQQHAAWFKKTPSAREPAQVMTHSCGANGSFGQLAPAWPLH